MAPLKLSQYRVVSAPVADGRTGRNKRVVFSTRSGEVRVIDASAWELVEFLKFDQLPNEILTQLIDTELLVPADQDELGLIIRRNKAAIADDDNLYLVIQPTSWCQLGCGYCGQEHTRGQLGSEDQELFLARVRKKLESKRYKTLELSWFGGEPLAGLNVIRAMTPRLSRLAAEASVLYTAKIVTNGLALTERVAAELIKELSVGSIEVTIDGSAPYHDARRHTKIGKPTFHLIFNNVVALAKRNDLAVNLTVRCNVDRRNYAGVLPLLQMLADAGVQNRISFYVAPVHSWGNDAHKGSLSAEEFSEWEIDWFVKMVELGFVPPSLPKRRPIVCFAVSPTAELVDAKGDLYNCTEVSYVPLYGQPNKYSIGTLKTGEIPGKRNLLGDFNDRVARGEYECATCRMLPVCGGRCPKLWQEGIVPCPSAKYNIESRLLIKYALSRLPAQAHSMAPSSD